MSELNQICTDLMYLGRNRVFLIRCINMMKNSLRAYIARVELGYGTKGPIADIPKKDREKMFEEAQKLIDDTIRRGATPKTKDLIDGVTSGIHPLENQRFLCESMMVGLAEQLPEKVVNFARGIRGFGKTSLLSLALIVAECGNLSLYENPGKVWKRLGCAPHEWEGKNLAGSTWRKGKERLALPSEEFVKMGYNPRRHSVSFLIGMALVNNNKDKYRERYDEAKARFKANHPDYSDMRCHLHGITCTAKRLFRDLWMVWNPDKVTGMNWQYKGWNRKYENQGATGILKP